MHNLLILVLFLGLLSKQSFADDSTKSHMREVLKNYLKLVPFMYSSKKVNKKTINKNLLNLEVALKKAKHDTMIKRPNFLPSVKIINNSIKEIQSIHNTGDKSYAQFRAKNLMRVCISCHSQLPPDGFKKIHTGQAKMINKYVKSYDDKAMVAFFLRDYAKSIHYFKKSFNKKMNIGRVHHNSISNLLAILKIYIINLEDESGAKKYFQSLMKNKKLLSSQKAIIKSWLSDLATKDIKKSKYISESVVRKYINSNLKNIEKDLLTFIEVSDSVKLFRSKKVLSHFAVKNPKSKLIPDILYWKGLIENQDNDLELYSLGNDYFRQCVYQYPATKSANKCFKAFKESMIFGFSGSSGLGLPLDVTKELKKMKTLLAKSQPK